MRHSMHTMLALCVALVLAASVSSCKRQEPEGPAPASAPTAGKAPATAAPEMTIALIMKTMSNPFFKKMEEGARQKAEELGVELQTQAQAREVDIDEQGNKVRNMIQAGVDAILIAPAGSKEIAPVLAEAKAAGLIVINLDNRVDPEAAEAAQLELDAYVGADNKEGGYMAGTHLAELLEGKGVVTMLEGIPSADNAIARREGFERAMAEHPDIQVIKPFQSGHWEQDEAYNLMTNLLSSHSEIQGLFCANDMMALGAMRAIDDAGRGGKVQVVSYDNLPEVQDALKSGALKGTIEQHPEIMGSKGVEIAVKLKKGEALTEEEKEFLVPLELITPESVL